MSLIMVEYVGVILVAGRLLFVTRSVVLDLFTLLTLHLNGTTLITFVSILYLLSGLFVLGRVALFNFTTAYYSTCAVNIILKLGLLRRCCNGSATRGAVIVDFILLVYCAVVDLVRLTCVPGMRSLTRPRFTCVLDDVPHVATTSLVICLFIRCISSLLCT